MTKDRYPRRSWTKSLLLGLLAVSLPLGAGAQPDEKHCFWEVKSPTGTLHLLGSIHFMKPDSYPLPAIIENTFERATTVAFETDIKALSDPSTAAKMAQAGACPPGKTLKDLVDAKVLRQLESALSDYGLPMEVVSGFRPWMAAVLLTTLNIQKQGYDPAQGIDQRFHGLALQQKKKIVALETVQSQLDLFSSLGQADESAFLMSTLTDLRKLPQIMGDMVDAWKSGRADKLDVLLNESLKEVPDIYNRFLVDRNRNWIPGIERLLKAGEPAVVIVGAGHLVGTNGVPEMLRRKGYTVTQK